ncbi:MFS transporter [Streptomyces sp. NPDC055808]
MSASSNPRPTALAPGGESGDPEVRTASAPAADLVVERFSVVPLVALSLSVFALCSAEFALIGLLLDVSGDMHVTVATAGQLLSVYAFAVAVGGPVVTVLTARMAPKKLALALLAIFAVANVLGALAPTFGMLMGARTIGALTHSTFAAVSILLAIRLSPPGRQASAIAWVAGGLGLATVLGGPLGTVIGEHWGWRATFWSVAGAAVIGALAIGFLIPGGLGGGQRVSLRSEVGALGKSQVLWAMGITVVSQTGWFLLYSYITPLLRQVTGFSAGVSAGMLFVFGMGGFIGNALGGRFADKSLRGTLAAMLAVLAAMLLLIGAGAGSPAPTVAAVLLIGLASGALVPPLQAWALGAAGGGSTLVLAANTSAFNLGNAAGSWTGSRLLGSGTAVNTLAYVGAAIVLLSLIGVLIALRNRPDSTTPPDGLAA